MAEEDGFLSRWSRRKAVVQGGKPALAEPVLEPRAEPATDPLTAPAGLPELRSPTLPPTDPTPPTQPEPAPLTLADVAALTRDSDYSAFVARGVSPDVRNAALKQLFTDPHYNLMDGLDTYIDDYGKPDPLPAGMLRKMTQTAFLKLFDDEPEAEADAALPAQSAVGHTPSPPEPAPDEDPDLRLQPDDAAGRTGPGAGPVEDPRRER